MKASTPIYLPCSNQTHQGAVQRRSVTAAEARAKIQFAGAGALGTGASAAAVCKDIREREKPIVDSGRFRLPNLRLHLSWDAIQIQVFMNEHSNLWSKTFYLL